MEIRGRGGLGRGLLLLRRFLGRLLGRFLGRFLGWLPGRFQGWLLRCLGREVD